MYLCHAKEDPGSNQPQLNLLSTKYVRKYISVHAYIKVCTLYILSMYLKKKEAILRPSLYSDVLLNVINGSSAHKQFNQVLSNSHIHACLSYFADEQTDKQTDKHWSFALIYGIIEPGNNFMP